MAKDRADKPRKEKGEKVKTPKDKVKKHKKEKKEKKLDDDGDAEMAEAANEPTEAEDPPVKSREPSVDIILDAPVKPKKSKKEKKEKKEKKSKKDEKSKKEEKSEEPTGEEQKYTTSFNNMTLPLRPASKDSKYSNDDSGSNLFAIDTKPTHVDVDSLETIPDKTPKPEKSKSNGYHPPPSGLNRDARRRIRMIEARRQIIRKKLGIPEGVTDKDDEVQAKLDEWIATMDGKMTARMDKKRQRKEKTAARLRNRRGKILTGERLKDRQKALRKIEKKVKRHGGGISVVNEAS
ncbi:hypothetical protein F5B19DRAFT_487881 [Rostrohypoxylon terebratum]|nr:hypothetical protein F5B19DRAFT_487881 [Rostrohypoxylon terebratum]